MTTHLQLGKPKSTEVSPIERERGRRGRVREEGGGNKFGRGEGERKKYIASKALWIISLGSTFLSCSSTSSGILASFFSSSFFSSSSAFATLNNPSRRERVSSSSREARETFASSFLDTIKKIEVRGPREEG